MLGQAGSFVGFQKFSSLDFMPIRNVRLSSSEENFGRPRLREGAGGQGSVKEAVRIGMRIAGSPQQLSVAPPDNLDVHAKS